MLNQKGMTLKELVIVVLLMALMVFLSIPAFFHLRQRAQDREVKKITGEIQAGVAAWHADNLMNNKIDAYPPQLDANEPTSTCKKCFSEVLKENFEHNLWFKSDEHTYYFSRNGNEGPASAYQESGDIRLTYNPATGSVTTESLP